MLKLNHLMILEQSHLATLHSYPVKFLCLLSCLCQVRTMIVATMLLFTSVFLFYLSKHVRLRINLLLEYISPSTELLLKSCPQIQQ